MQFTGLKMLFSGLISYKFLSQSYHSVKTATTNIFATRPRAFRLFVKAMKWLEQMGAMSRARLPPLGGSLISLLVYN